jgi:DNA-binding MarR family transcriptional regulator
VDQGIEVLFYGKQFKKLYEKEIAYLRDRYQLKRIDVDILYCLYESGERNTSRDINVLNYYNKGHISQSVLHMQEQKLLERVQDDADRRRVHLKLTPKAQEIVGQIKAIRKKILTVLFEGVTEEEQQMLIAVSHKIKQNIEKALL